MKIVVIIFAVLITAVTAIAADYQQEEATNNPVNLRAFITALESMQIDNRSKNEEPPDIVDDIDAFLSDNPDYELLTQIQYDIAMVYLYHQRYEDAAALLVGLEHDIETNQLLYGISPFPCGKIENPYRIDINSTEKTQQDMQLQFDFYEMGEYAYKAALIALVFLDDSELAREYASFAVKNKPNTRNCEKARRLILYCDRYDAEVK